MDDDGEKGGALAIMRVLEKEAVLDVAVVCSRWYGGTLLGPM
jgi:putative IMPACT (imprinted ancient) family translation regulator